MEDKYAPCSTETHAIILSWECPCNLELLLSRAWAGARWSVVPLAAQCLWQSPSMTVRWTSGAPGIAWNKEDWKQLLPVWKIMGRKELVAQWKDTLLPALLIYPGRER